jgi:hypothetical protein
MDWLLHLVHNDHGEWNAFVAFFSTDASTLSRWMVSLLPPARWRVVHCKVTPPFFFNTQVEEIIYGPYRSFVVACFVAYFVCGKWDVCDIQERR